MFNIGGGELIVIMVIALIVLGPKRLPDAARQIGKVMGDLRRLSTSFQSEVRTALDTSDDPNQVASRRNVLASEEAAPAPEPHPARTEPLVAAPVPPDPDPADVPAKPAPAKASKAPAKTTPAKPAASKNGTAVEKATPSKAAPRRTES
jgi:sec-independent protein translocase protein TatB